MRPNMKNRNRVRTGIDRKQQPSVMIDQDVLVGV